MANNIINSLKKEDNKGFFIKTIEKLNDISIYIAVGALLLTPYTFLPVLISYLVANFSMSLITQAYNDKTQVKKQIKDEFSSLGEYEKLIMMKSTYDIISNLSFTKKDAINYKKELLELIDSEYKLNLEKKQSVTQSIKNAIFDIDNISNFNVQNLFNLYKEKQVNINLSKKLELLFGKDGPDLFKKEYGFSINELTITSVPQESNSNIEEVKQNLKNNNKENLINFGIKYDELNELKDKIHYLNNLELSEENKNIINDIKKDVLNIDDMLFNIVKVRNKNLVINEINTINDLINSYSQATSIIEEKYVLETLNLSKNLKILTEHNKKRSKSL